MKKITLPKASVLTSPNPVTLVCTEKADGSANLATVSWWTYLSYNPWMIAFAMAKPSYSGEMVRKTRQVVLTIPGAALKDVVLTCGSCTGRDTDKAAKTGVDLVSLPDTPIRVPARSRVAIVCDLAEFHEVGDHYLYVCNVKAVYANEEETPLFAWDGYAKIAPVPVS